MPNFKLMLTRDLTESCAVVVDAANQQDALHVAHSRISSGEIDPDWAIDEDARCNGDIYCGDPDAIEETDEPVTVNPGPQWVKPASHVLHSLVADLDRFGFGDDDADLNGGDLVDLINAHIEDMRRACV